MSVSSMAVEDASSSRSFAAVVIVVLAGTMMFCTGVTPINPEVEAMAVS